MVVMLFGRPVCSDFAEVLNLGSIVFGFLFDVFLANVPPGMNIVMKMFSKE
jgi:hypothetical protein